MFGHTRLAVLTILFGCVYGAQDARTPIECQDRQTKISSWHAYSTSTRKTCAQLISGGTDRYNPYFISDCKRWMGESHQDRIADYKVVSCQKLSNGTLKYKADVCCYGEPEMRCFDCQDFKSATNCRSKTSTKVCDAGQVCLTSVSYYGDYPRTQMRRTTGCADPGVCASARDTNAGKCKDWLTDPECHYCCDKPFCNYHPPKGPDLYVGDDPCLSEPCQNGATCSSAAPPEISYQCECAPGYNGTYCEQLIEDKCLSSPCRHGGYCIPKGFGYHCKCPAGRTGGDCEMEYPECGPGENICLNGGTCYDHGEFGLRCKCADGFLGTTCEEGRGVCFYDGSYRAGKSVRKIPNTDCTTVLLKDQEKVEDKNALRVCANFMRGRGMPRFDNNFDGNVDEIESRTQVQCNSGDEYTFITSAWCCPTCHSMPCMNDGWCTQADDGDYICECRKGWFGRNCEIRNNVCLITGDPHHVTFDSAFISFQGGGSYQLVKSNGKSDEKFSVNSKNEKIGQISYLLELTVSVCQHIVILERNNVVSVDGQYTDPSSHLSFDCLTISMNGESVRLETSFGMVVQYDGVHTGLIQLPLEYMRKVRGLCGDFNGDTRNDYKAMDGTDYRNEENRDYYTGVGWELDGNGNSSPDEPLECDPISDVQDSYCSILMDNTGVFGECMSDSFINGDDATVNNALTACQYDVCANWPDADVMADAACDAMEGLATECQLAGYSVKWREASNCVLECQVGMEYSSSANACPASCRNPEAPASCTLPEVEACVCKEGTLLYNGECLTPEDCGCVDDVGNQHAIGQTWNSVDCLKSYLCVACEDCSQSIGKIEEQPYGCGDGDICADSGDGQYTCVPFDDPCDEPSPCRNEGECITLGLDEYKCACRAGYSGKTCYRKRPECASGTDFCQNGGTCYDHGNRFGYRCRCAEGFVGTRCEYPTITCPDATTQRVQRSVAVRHKVDCTTEMLRLQPKLDDKNGLKFCLPFMQKRNGNDRPFADELDGSVTKVFKRFFSFCEMGETYTFFKNDWCCPSCYAMPCLNGGFCTQLAHNDYQCACKDGYVGRNCDIAPP